mmetsp:Transcript_51233/g.122770  ORF Transcript_51233/g.122770 Transcript_51233/m.122770 type:complete len:210 (-) Transcript_51233:2598-3227(-)
MQARVRASQELLQVFEGYRSCALGVDQEEHLVPVAFHVVPPGDALAHHLHDPRQVFIAALGPHGQLVLVHELHKFLEGDLATSIGIKPAPKHQQLVSRHPGAAQATIEGILKLGKGGAPAVVRIDLREEAIPPGDGGALDALLVEVRGQGLAETLRHHAESRVLRWRWAEQCSLGAEGCRPTCNTSEVLISLRGGVGEATDFRCGQEVR